MKKSGYQHRFYRDWVYARGMYSVKVVVEESDLSISSNKKIDGAYCADRVAHYRRQIQAYIARDERFFSSLGPVPVDPSAPSIVKDMAQAARLSGVGPMAAVAGAIAQYVGKDIIRQGSRDVIVENGGDVFLRADAPVMAGIYAGKSRLSGNLRIKIDLRGRSCGLCTSSGTVGHSLSFGKADAAVILADNAILADAAATAVANAVKKKEDLPAAVALARSIKGVKGVILIEKNNLASWGMIEFA